jgi:RES domain
VINPPDATDLQVACFRVCDRRFPFLWASAAQPPGRWHDAGQGPCHYLGSAPKVCWAEVLRHENIRDPDDVDDLDCAMWVVGVLPPTGVPTLPLEILTGDTMSYPPCRAEAQRLRNAGHAGLRAPSAAVQSGEVEMYGVDSVTQLVAAEVVAIWSTAPGVAGSPIGHGTADPAVLADVRYL